MDNAKYQCYRNDTYKDIVLFIEPWIKYLLP